MSSQESPADGGKPRSEIWSTIGRLMFDGLVGLGAASGGVWYADPALMNPDAPVPAPDDDEEA